MLLLCHGFEYEYRLSIQIEEGLQDKSCAEASDLLYLYQKVELVFTYQSTKDRIRGMKITA